MVNSIKDCLNDTDVISEITLLLGQSRNAVCVVVEGEDDQKIFRPLLSNNVMLFRSYSGKNGVEDIVKNRFASNKRVVGIRDKDYLVHTSNPRLFFCDYCCAEMMIIAIDECFERLYSEFYGVGVFTYEQLRIYCLKHLEMLSKYRQLNEHHDWKIKFDGIKPSKMYMDSISDMDTKILNEINCQNPDNQIDTARQAYYNILPECTSLPDYLDITNGHDFVNLFYKVCTGKHGNNGIALISSSLRSTLGKSEFKKTLLYTNLFNYQQNKKIKIVE